MTTFAELGVPADLVAVLDRQRITEPFPIQAAAIPDGMYGRDVLGRAPTGSGKTLAFGIPAVAKLGQADPGMPRALILSPTRELADQIRAALEPLAAARDRTVLAVYGGVGLGSQISALQAGADLVVATPGRLMDLMDKGEIGLDAVRYLVIDEADRMADMGFLPDVISILDRAGARKQTLLFSATLGKEVQVLTERYQTDPVTHEAGEVRPDLSLVSHRFIRTTRQNKLPVAVEVLRESGATIVFCRTRNGVDRVARQLKAEGIKTGLIHGDRSQNQRESALKLFMRGKVDVLVATDVAARGIHVDGVECVVHYDMPEDDKAYVHRSGRTARAGAVGQVVCFVNSDQERDMWRIQQLVGLEAELEPTPPVAVHAAREAARAAELEASLRDRSREGTGGRQRKPKKKPGPSAKAGGNSTKGKNKNKSKGKGKGRAQPKSSGTARPQGSKGGAARGRSTAGDRGPKPAAKKNRTNRRPR